MAEMNTIVEGKVKYREGKKVRFFIFKDFLAEYVEHKYLNFLLQSDVSAFSFSGNQDGAL